MPPRRFPPPWTFEDHNNACVKDANGANVAYVYYEEEPGPAHTANLMTRDEARRIAMIAKLRVLVRSDAGGACQPVLKMLGGQLVKSERKMAWRAWTQYIRRSAANWIVGSVGGR